MKLQASTAADSEDNGGSKKKEEIKRKTEFICRSMFSS